MHSPPTGKQPRHISAAEAAGLVRSGDWVDYGVTLLAPDVFDRALAARAAELRSVKIRSCISLREPLINKAPMVQIDRYTAETA